MNNLPIVKNSVTIRTNEFVVGQSLIKFKVPQELKNLGGQRVATQAIQVFNTDQISSFQGLTPFVVADMPKMVLSLVTMDKLERIKEIPLTSFIRSSNGGYYYLLANLEIDWEKSYVTVFDSTGLSANEVLPIEVIYLTNNPGI